MYRELLVLFLCSVSQKEQIKVWKENTVNDLRYEIKFANCVKDKNGLFIKRIGIQIFKILAYRFR